jgi:acyl carrier protein
MTEPSNPEQRSKLIEELKIMIVETLNLDDVAPSDISEEEPLFDSGLDLDSIDALELVVSLEKKYEIKIGSSEESKAALESVNTLADLILSKLS